MGRAIVRQPQAFLMDEPLSNLDAKLRADALRDPQAPEGSRRHDRVRHLRPGRAMTMGDRVAVMKKGVLQQVAPPQLLYENPDNLFVAGFIGSPAMNLVQGELQVDGEAAGHRRDPAHHARRQGHRRRPALAATPGDGSSSACASRTWRTRRCSPTARRSAARATASIVEALGSESPRPLQIERRWSSPADTKEPPPTGDPRQPRPVRRRGTTEMVARSPRSDASNDDPIELAVDTARVALLRHRLGTGDPRLTPDRRSPPMRRLVRLFAPLACSLGRGMRRRRRWRWRWGWRWCGGPMPPTCRGRAGGGHLDRRRAGTLPGGPARRRPTGATITYTPAGDNMDVFLEGRLARGRRAWTWRSSPSLAAPPAQEDLVALTDGPSGRGQLDEGLQEARASTASPMGAPFKSANKSLLWYNPTVLEDAGVEPPADWDDCRRVRRRSPTQGDAGVGRRRRGLAAHRLLRERPVVDRGRRVLRPARQRRGLLGFR